MLLVLLTTVAVSACSTEAFYNAIQDDAAEQCNLTIRTGRSYCPMPGSTDYEIYREQRDAIADSSARGAFHPAW